jgi:hypothetical protein
MRKPPAHRRPGRAFAHDRPGCLAEVVVKQGTARPFNERQ